MLSSDSLLFHCHAFEDIIYIDTHVDSVLMSLIKKDDKTITLQIHFSDRKGK